ncbi:MAG: hypothetical protein ACKVT2_11975 [Saprospiraceae bacterium]
MKHSLIFASLVLIALVAACKKDAEPGPKPEDLIIGKWKASRAFVDTTDLLVPTSTLERELEIEFKADKTVAFYRKSTFLNTNPPVVTESTLDGVYSWNGNVITITGISGADSRTVIGPIDITETHFLFTATSGDTTEFYSLLEADKL